MENPKLSILILSAPERLDKLSKLLQELFNQIIGREIEVIYLGDNLKMTVGEKRNKAVSAARGEYVCFIDDDDMIAKNYIEKIYEAILKKPDVVTFLVRKTYNGKPEQIQKFERIGRRILDPTLKQKFGMKVLTMPPNHLCVWDKSIFMGDCRFPHKNKGEDHAFAEKVFEKYGDDLRKIDIDEVLYYYDYQTNVSLTQTR